MRSWLSSLPVTMYQPVAPPDSSTLSLHDALPISHQAVDVGPHRHAGDGDELNADRKSTRLNSSHLVISYAVFCLKKKKNNATPTKHRETSSYPLLVTEEEA